MKKYVLLLLLSGALLGLKAQNLVPNPSFEKVNEIKKRWSGTHFDFNHRMQNWNSPTQGSPDILFIKLLGEMTPPRPQVDLSPYQPRTGKMMLGIKVYGCTAGTLHCKEYLQVELREPLLPGQKYYYEYWVQGIATSVKVNGFGIALSEAPIEDRMTLGLLDIPAITTPTEIIASPEIKWHKVSGTFTAESAATQLLIGNFSADFELDYYEELEGLEYGYYLIDDVLLKPVAEPAKPKFATSQTIILENVQFEFNQSRLIGESKKELNELLQYLASIDYHRVKIRGHTDVVGTASYNQKLSEKRSAAVRDYLLEQGIPAEKIEAIGYGSTRPLTQGNSEIHRAQNRRVEIEIER